MLEDPKIKRLKELSKLDYPSDQDYKELETLKEELGLTSEDLNQHEAIKPIQIYQKIQSKRQAQQEELRSLTTKRKELQIILEIRKEKERIKRIKNQLDGLIYCDDCHEWKHPSHFDE